MDVVEIHIFAELKAHYIVTFGGIKYVVAQTDTFTVYGKLYTYTDKLRSYTNVVQSNPVW